MPAPRSKVTSSRYSKYGITLMCYGCRFLKRVLGLLSSCGSAFPNQVIQKIALDRHSAGLHNEVAKQSVGASRCSKVSYLFGQMSILILSRISISGTTRSTWKSVRAFLVSCGLDALAPYMGKCRTWLFTEQWGYMVLLLSRI